MSNTFKVLSIDAWRNECGGWDWNNWFNSGEITLPDDKALDSARIVLREMREQGFLSESSKGRCDIYDDCFNVVIRDRNTLEPLFAIEYGNIPEYS